MYGLELAGVMSCAPTRNVKVAHDIRFGDNECMISAGRVCAEDLLGHDRADAAADHGRLRQHEAVFDVRGAVLRALGQWWFPIMLDMHTFMVAV